MRYQDLPLEPQGNITPNISIGRRIHPIWKEWSELLVKQLHYRESIIGKYQYIYESKKGRISLIELPNYFRDGIDYWEICGAMTPDGDVERFDTKQEAEVRIKELLE